jgi:hypothetical protein
LGAEGVEDYQAGNYAAASDKLGRAFSILRVPSLGLWSARALAKEGKLIEASERYLSVTRLDATKGETAVQKQAQAEAATERDALQPRIPGLTLEVKGASADVSVTLDGQPVPAALIGVRQPSNPGKHVAEARDGGRLVRKELTLNEAQRMTLTLDFANAIAAPAAESTPPPPAAAPTGATPPAPSPAAPATDRGGRGVPAGVWVGLAIAGAGLATGGVTAVLASGKKSDLNCPENHCLPEQSADVDAHNQLLTVSTIGFIAAGVGVATAGIFWFSRPKEPEHARHVTPWLGLGSAGIRGAF